MTTTKPRATETEAEKKTRRRLANRESARRMRMRRVETVCVLRQQLSNLTQQHLKTVASNVKLVERLHATVAALKAAKEENTNLQAQMQRVYEMACGSGSAPAASAPLPPLVVPPLDMACLQGMGMQPQGLFSTSAASTQQALAASVCPTPDLALPLAPPACNLSNFSSNSPLCSGVLSSDTSILSGSSFMDDTGAPSSIHLDKPFDMGLSLSPTAAGCIVDDSFMSFAASAILSQPTGGPASPALHQHPLSAGMVPGAPSSMVADAVSGGYPATAQRF